MTGLRIAIIGASGGIGLAMLKLLSSNPGNTLYAFSRSPLNLSANNIRSGHIDYSDEATIQQAAVLAAQQGPLDWVLVTTGILHDETTMPEKSLRELSTENFQKNFLINTIGPALIAKHFIPQLHKKQRAIFAALSARVGSIADNHLGGWYAYRASKAALNMLIKTTSIEIARKYKKAIIVGLHPGTVNTGLSSPFQQRVPPEKLFTPDYSAKQLIQVINNLQIQDTGKIFAWDSQEIPY